MQVFRPSQPFECHELQVRHLLSCGSFSTPFHVPGIKEFSRYKVMPFTKFPNYQNKPQTTTVFIILKGEGKFDGKLYSAGMTITNPTDIGGNEKDELEFLRLRLDTKSIVEGEGLNGDSSRILESGEWGIHRQNLGEKQVIQLGGKGRSFVYVITGKAKVDGRCQQVVEGEAILTQKLVQMTATKKSEIIVVELRD